MGAERNLGSSLVHVQCGSVSNDPLNLGQCECSYFVHLKTMYMIKPE